MFCWVVRDFGTDWPRGVAVDVTTVSRCSPQCVSHLHAEEVCRRPFSHSGLGTLTTEGRPELRGRTHRNSGKGSEYLAQQVISIGDGIMAESRFQGSNVGAGG